MARLWPALSGIITFGVSNVDVFAQPTPDNGASPGPATGFTCKMGKQHELDDVEAGEGTLDLLNLRGHYTPGNAASPYYPNVLPMRPYTQTATYAGTTYPVFSGFVERFPISFDGKYGLTKAVLVDGLSKLSRTPLPSAADGECRLDNPTYLYRMDEAVGSSGAGDSINPGVNPAAIQINSKYGAATLVFGAATGLADGATGVSFGSVYTYSVTDPTPGSTGKVSLLSIADQSRSGPALPNAAFTIDYWVVMPSSAPVGATPAYIAQQARNDNTAGISLALYSDGKVYFQHFKAGFGLTTVPSLSRICDGALHHFAASVDSDLRTMKFTIDGVLQGTTVAASTLDLSNYDTNHIGGRIFANGTIGDQFPGIVCRAALYPSSLSLARIQAHYNAGKTAFAGEASGTRVGRILDYAGWPAGKRTLQTGVSTMGPALIAGTDAFSALKDVNSTELGLLFVDASGNVVFRSRDDRWTRRTSTYTLGDDSSGLNNMFSLENFSFEGGTVGNWTGAGFGYTTSTLANTATFAQVGAKALQVTLPAATALHAGGLLNMTGLVIGQQYCVSAYVRVPTGTPAIRMTEAFGAWSMPAAAGYPAISTVNDAFQRLACTFVATATSGWLGLVCNTASTAGQLFVIDGVILEIGALPSSTGMEIPFLPDVIFDDDPALLINDLTISREGGATVRAVDGTSVTAYGNSGTTRTSNASTDGEAADQANWLIAQFKDPKLRIEKLVIDAGANPAVFPQVLAMQLGDRVTVHRRSAQADVTGDFFIENKEVEGDSSTFTVALALNPADTPRAVLWDTDNWDDATTGWGF